jgi:hypothetical protein
MEVMNSKKYNISKSVVTLIALGWMMVGAGLLTAQQNNQVSGVEVMTRGPVHEAFAGTVSYDPKPGMIVNVKPPNPIDEVPPSQRLEGDHVAWIPGYWARDEEINDFLWVSGIWRNLPPGRQWVPGYWTEVEGHYQWTSGYWEDAEVTEVSYLPEPPRSVETGPNIDAASRDQTWIPGSWIWRDSRYAWRAGYWAPVRENWIWVPSYYRWTRHGYVYVDGYWDYAVARRGVIFAPVHFDRDVYSRPDFYYSPATVIGLTLLVDHLFLRPSYDHYYFGDYYAPEYRDRGFFASVSYNSSRRGYDPIYAYDRWQNRKNSNWAATRLGDFEYLRDHASARPPHTYAALASLPQASSKTRAVTALASPLDRYVSAGGNGRQSFHAVGAKDRTRIVSQNQEVQRFTKERQQLETQATSSSTSAAAGVDRSRVKVNRSPIVAKPSTRVGKTGGPPARLEISNLQQEKAASRALKVKPSASANQVESSKPADRRVAPKSPPAATKQVVEPRSNGKGGTQIPSKVPAETKRSVESPPSRTVVPESKRQQEARTIPEVKTPPKTFPSTRAPRATRPVQPAHQKKVPPTPPAAEPKARIEKKQSPPQVQQSPMRRPESAAPQPQKQIQRQPAVTAAPHVQPERRVAPAPAPAATAKPAPKKNHAEDPTQKKNPPE